MYVSRFSAEDRLHTVGYYDPGGAWHGTADCDSEDKAQNLIHFLNGGMAPEVDLLTEAVNLLSVRISKFLDLISASLEKRVEEIREAIKTGKPLEA